MAFSRKKTVLVSPLDWGLGHATRCVPIIQELINQDVEVILGISGLSGEWLRKTFPMLETVEVPFSEIKYHRWLPMEVTAMARYPAVVKMIDEEHRWLKSFCRQRTVQAIISDNRYGLFHPHIQSVCITHQLYIQPGRLLFLKPLLNRLTQAYLKNFHQIWVPDFSGSFSLSGSLSHPPCPTYPIQYIGVLSRFNRINEPKHENVTYSVAFVLSGPEPLRTVFENRCIEIARNIKGTSVIIRGTNKPLNNTVPNNCHVINIADTQQLYQTIQQAACVVSRAGYSSIMDWYVLNKKAVLVPTPGQTEQEYLARHLHRLGLFYCVKETDLTEEAIQRAFFASLEVKQQYVLNRIIHEWLQAL
jgi:predicted glycosyltransferase